METGPAELAAVRWLDAEDATMQQALAWALEHDQGTALRLALALAPWWFRRDRWAEGYRLLASAAGHAPQGGPHWCAAQFWLGLLTAGSQVATSFGHLSAVTAVLAQDSPGPLMARALAWRAGCLANLGRLPEAAQEARRALTLARQLGDPFAEASALFWLGGTALYAGVYQECLAWLRQTQRIDYSAGPGWLARQCGILLAEALGMGGEEAEARRQFAEVLAQARQAGALFDQGECLRGMAGLELDAGALAQARAHLREAIGVCAQTGAGVLLTNCLWLCGRLSAAGQRWNDAATAMAAYTAIRQTANFASTPDDQEQYQELLRKTREALGPVAARAAEERGSAMTPDTAAQYVLLVTAEPGEPAAVPGATQLSARERELVTLVAQGRTDAQIAAQLFISIRTVSSHLDRIRDKTGCRRRADLTRLALQAGLA